MSRSRIIQIAVGSDSRHSDRLYALDVEGVVWRLDEADTANGNTGWKQVGRGPRGVIPPSHRLMAGAPNP